MASQPKYAENAPMSIHYNAHVVAYYREMAKKQKLCDTCQEKMSAASHYYYMADREELRRVYWQMINDH